MDDFDDDGDGGNDHMQFPKVDTAEGCRTNVLRGMELLQNMAIVATRRQDICRKARYKESHIDLLCDLNHDHRTCEAMIGW
jgi:hypothetical protein